MATMDSEYLSSLNQAERQQIQIEAAAKIKSAIQAIDFTYNRLIDHPKFKKCLGRQISLPCLKKYLAGEFSQKRPMIFLNFVNSAAQFFGVPTKIFFDPQIDDQKLRRIVRQRFLDWENETFSSPKSPSKPSQRNSASEPEDFRKTRNLGFQESGEFVFTIKDTVLKKLTARHRQKNFPATKIFQRKIFFTFKKGISERLIILLHGLGLDHREQNFQDFIRKNENDSILAPTLLGFHPDDHTDLEPPTISLELHGLLINQLIEEMFAIHKPGNLIVVGFSVGGDLAFDLVREATYPVEACVLLDANINHETCFISNKLKDLRTDSDILSIVTEAAGNKIHFKDFQDWDNLVRYFQIVFRKFKEANIECLVDFAAQIAGRFECDGVDYFVEKYRSISRKCKILCVFSNCKSNLSGYDQVLEFHLKQEEFLLDDSFEPPLNVGHFDLILPQNLERFISEAAKSGV